MTDAISKAFADSALISHQATADLIPIDVKTLKKEGDCGRIRYCLIGKRSRRYAEADIRIYIDKIKATPCQVLPKPKASSESRGRRSGNTTSSAEVFDFLDQRRKRMSAKPQRSSAH